jgi:hypothetical protein
LKRGATLIGSVPYEEIKKGRATLTYTDQLELASDPARLRYAIRYVNAAGQRAAFSNFFLMTPAFKVAVPPADINFEKQETANIITWQAPTRNMDGSTPVNLLGYNVYRISKSQPESDLKPLNAEPVTPRAMRTSDSNSARLTRILLEPCPSERKPGRLRV